MTRALYKKAPVLILDEATNALDAATEGRVMSSLAGRDVTLIVAAHRGSALAVCDRVLGLEGGRFVELERSAHQAAVLG